MLSRGVQGLLMVGLALALGAGARAESRGRVRMFPRVLVDSASMTLADLLPAAAPGGVRDRAARILLGAAPLAGSPRRFSREEIESWLGPRLAGELEIPESVVVERRARELSREEVLAAIRAALGEKGFLNAGALGLEDVSVGMPVMVTTAEPGLRVLGMKLDPALHLAVFRLWTAKEQAVRPFDVIVRPVDGLAQWMAPTTATGTDAASRLIEARTRMAERAAAIARRARQRGKPLVMALRTASLVLVSGTMEIHTTVEALERGYLGEIIRVRMKNTRQVIRAKVVAPGCLEAGF